MGANDLSKILLVAVCLFFLSLSVQDFIAIVYGQNVTCSASVSPASVSLSSSTSFEFTITNTSSNTIRWAKIAVPEEISITSHSTGSWTTNGDETEVNFYSGTINPSESNTFTIVATANQLQSSADWYTEVSDDANGANPGSCTGSYSVAIVNATSTPTPTASSSSSSTSATSTPTQTPTPTPDTTPPKVTLSGRFNNPVQDPGRIFGQASDTRDILRVEYSIDDGKNWTILKKGDTKTKSVDFSFAPPITEDGNYKISVRATDSAGNTGRSMTGLIIIDRLPPKIGGTSFTVGPQLLEYDEAGILNLLANSKQKVIFSAAGGPTTIDLFSSKTDFSSQSASPIVMRKNESIGLWEGYITLSSPGEYIIEARAVDGAQNYTRTQIAKAHVLSSGVVLDKQNIPVKSVELIVYVFNERFNQFVRWDAASYSQQNPQFTNEKGEYLLTLPQGTYYIVIKSKAHKTAQTNIFTIKKTQPVNTKFKLEKKYALDLGIFQIPLPDFSSTKVSIVSSTKQDSGKNILIGTQLPSFSLKSEDKEITNYSIRGNPSILTFLSSWMPHTASQLEEIEKVTFENKEINPIVVFAQESISSTYAFKKRGGYQTPIYADTNGLVLEKFKSNILPLHVFINRKGIIQKIKSGVLSQNELINNL